MKKLIASLLSLTTVGCAFVPAETVIFYPGGSKTESETAALAYIWRPHNTEGGVIIKSIDGIPFEHANHVKAILLPPGKHTFLIHYEKFEPLDLDKYLKTTAHKILEANLKAGEKYAIQSYVEGNSIIFRVANLGKHYPIECLNSLR